MIGMRRVLFYLTQVGVLVALAVWLSDHPGKVEINWLGYRIETYFGVLVLVLAILLILTSACYRFWRSLLGAPQKFLSQRRMSERATDCFLNAFANPGKPFLEEPAMAPVPEGIPEYEPPEEEASIETQDIQQEIVDQPPAADPFMQQEEGEAEEDSAGSRRRVEEELDKTKEYVQKRLKETTR